MSEIDEDGYVEMGGLAYYVTSARQRCGYDGTDNPCDGTCPKCDPALWAPGGAQYQGPTVFEGYDVEAGGQVFHVRPEHLRTEPDPRVQPFSESERANRMRTIIGALEMTVMSGNRPERIESFPTEDEVAPITRWQRFRWWLADWHFHWPLCRGDHYSNDYWD